VVAVTIFKHEFHEDKSDEYATPGDLWRPIADAVDGFDLDPASGAEDTPIASTRFTAEDDGLTERWFGTVWLNPPFSLKEDFLEKCITEWRDGRIDLGVVLLPVDTSTGWFHEHVASTASLIWFKQGRVSFDGAGGRNRNPNFGVMVAVYGDAPDELLDYFDRHGVVFEQRDRHTRTHQTTLVQTDGGRNIRSVDTETDRPASERSRNGDN
jgi:phage N-6-adenine-methyltransferase